MAWSSVAISAADLAYMAADKPILAANATPTSPSNVRWNQEGTAAGTDDTDADYPTCRAYDGLPHLDTRPDSGEAANTQYLVYNFGELITFDAIAIIGHNFGTLALTAVTVEVADDGDFAGGDLAAIADFGAPADDDRLIDLDLVSGTDHNRRVTAQYARIKLVKGATHTPEIGEVLFLRRRQLPRKFEYPYDNSTLVDSVERAESQSGVVQVVRYFSRRKHLEGRMALETATERSDLLAWHRQAGANFVWIEDPTTAPDSWSMMTRPDPRINGVNEVYGKYIFELSADEQGPERFFLDQE